MNVVVVNDFAHINGGASNIALGSAVALAQRGHFVTFFSSVAPVDSSLLNVQNLQVICLDQYEAVTDPNRARAMLQGCWNRPAESSLGEILRSMDPSKTVVHVHSWIKALSASIVHKAIAQGFPVVITLHDYFSVCPTGSFFIHPSQQICHLKPMSSACIRTNCDSRLYAHKLWRVGRQWVQSHFGGIPDAVMDYIAISDLSESVLRPLLPAQAKVHRVRNFIDVAQGSPVDVATNTLFTFSGRLSPEKGPQLLALCSSLLDLEVLFIGGGPMQEELSKIAPKASFTGWISPPAAREAMRQSRALVFPSLWYETQGLVVAEAAAMGVPVIVPTTCAAAEWVEDGVTGLLFRGGDAADLAAQITRLRENPDQAVSMGRNAYDRYWQDPATIASHCSGLEGVYGSMLQKKYPATPQNQEPTPVLERMKPFSLAGRPATAQETS